MKNVALVGCLIFPLFLVAQSAEHSTTNKDNLYAVALEASIKQMEKDWGYIDDSLHGERIRTDYHRVLVEKNPVITEKLPSKFGDRSVEYLDNESLINRYSRMKKSFAVLRIWPIRNDGDKLIVNVSVYWISYRKRELRFGLSDWSDVEFQHDCGQHRFIITSVKLGGI